MVLVQVEDKGTARTLSGKVSRPRKQRSRHLAQKRNPAWRAALVATEAWVVAEVLLEEVRGEAVAVGSAGTQVLTSLPGRLDGDVLSQDRDRPFGTIRRACTDVPRP